MEKKLILLVEDNPNDIELTRRALKNARIANELVVAQDGVEALDYLRIGDSQAESPRQVDRPPDGVDWSLPVVVLLDLKLPRIDGAEVLRRIRANERTKLLPVVVLTSSNLEEDMVQTYSLHANSYVRKPVKFTEFVEAIQQLGLYWLVLNEVPRQR
ncbi:MAG: response regulator [Chloroflexi bacterium]|nr:response regulator [Chloroflexota bacterium]